MECNLPASVLEEENYVLNYLWTVIRAQHTRIWYSQSAHNYETQWLFIILFSDKSFSVYYCKLWLISACAYERRIPVR